MASKARAEEKKENQWNLGGLYANLEEWEAAYRACLKGQTQASKWPEIAAYRKRLGEGGAVVAELINIFFAVERHILKLYTYAQHKQDEDLSVATAKSAYERATMLYFDFKSETAWIQPELLQLPVDQFKSYLEDDALAPYQVFLKNIFTLKPYTLSEEQEGLLALAGAPLETPAKAFTALNNVDLLFPDAVNEKGERFPLTHARYGRYLEAQDRKLRESAFCGVHRVFQGFGHTLSELIGGQVQKLLLDARARGYPSCLHAALTPHQIDPEVYHNLVRTVRHHGPLLHRYMELRRRLLDVDILHSWDMHVPLVPACDKAYGFDEAVAMTVASVAPLGTEYQQRLERGLLEERWVDRYENRGKRSGAYSGGCYDSAPFILLNYEGTFRDVMTLAHEAGHSMHSLLSRRHQPYHQADYPIFVAEVASTLNEELLFRYLLDKVESQEEKGYLLSRRLDDIRATLFRQTQFAEFELRLHTLAEQQVPLTAELLQQEYANLNAAYYGEAVHRDPEIGAECLRIPHFYSSFYVYQYATGISAAFALAERVLEQGEEARAQYLNFLGSGSSRYPLDLLELAGVDMRQPEPIEQLLKRFKELLDLFEETVSLKERL